MTLTDIESTILEDLDHEIPCDWQGAEGCGGRNPAEWAIWLRIICEHQGGDFIYLCNPDKEWYLTRTLLYCRTMTHFTTPAQVIIRMERIKG